MPDIEIPFASQEGKSSIAQNSQETLINMFVEVETSGRKRLVRRQRKALVSVAAISGEKRCIERNGSMHYCVIGNKAYSYDGSGLTELGTLNTETGRCSMIFDELDNMMISDGVESYHWDGTTFQTITTPTATGTVAFLGGFGIYNEPDTGVFWVSGINDFLTWDGLNYATTEAKKDDLVRVYADHGELWMLGTESIEIWQLTGGSFPFTRQNQTIIERGLGAAYAVTSEDNTIFWLGEDFIVYRADGYRPQRISAHPIERQIDRLTDAVKATGEMFVYADQGHKFVVLRFPGYLTVQYNLSTGSWNRCKTYNRDDWDIVGSAFDQTGYYLTEGGICTLQRGTNTDEGAVMERGGISAPIADGTRRLAFKSFLLDCEVGGVGVNADVPQVMLQISKDGETFGNERLRNLGLTGDYSRRPMWRNLGLSRKFYVKFMFTDGAEFAVIRAEANIS